MLSGETGTVRSDHDGSRPGGIIRQLRRRIIIATGISTADTKTAAQIRPAGVVRPVAVIVARLPSLKWTVPFISSGCGAAVADLNSPSRGDSLPCLVMPNPF